MKFKWTDEPPTEAGHYWWVEEGDYVVYHVKICAGPGRGVSCYFPMKSIHSDGITTPQEMGGLWAGPIPIPTPPTKRPC